MAENESLDLGSSNARRWDQVVQAVQQGESCETVARHVNKKLHDGLRKALKQIAEAGAPLGQFVVGRHNLEELRQLVKNSKGHPYAQLLVDTANAEPGLGDEGLLQAFVNGVWDTMSDQIAHQVGGTDRFPSLVDAQIFLNQVTDQIDGDVRRIARMLAQDPAWQPKRAGKKGQKADPTTDMLQMSLMGTQQK